MTYVHTCVYHRWHSACVYSVKTSKLFFSFFYCLFFLFFLFSLFFYFLFFFSSSLFSPLNLFLFSSANHLLNSTRRDLAIIDSKKSASSKICIGVPMTSKGTKMGKYQHPPYTHTHTYVSKRTSAETFVFLRTQCMHDNVYGLFLLLHLSYNWWQMSLWNKLSNNKITSLDMHVCCTYRRGSRKSVLDQFVWFFHEINWLAL